MAPDPNGGARPPVVLRIKLRYEDVEAMVQRFAPNVGKSGLFLPTKSLQPIGAEVKFELRLANDQPVLLGLGKVKVAKQPDPANPKASFGMAIELMRVTRESRDLILKMLERRKQLGLAEVAIPMPADLDAARRTDVDTGVKDASASAVPMAVPVRDSQPVVESAPIPVAIAPRDSQPESLLTAPRRATGPLAIAKVTSIDPLPPEPPRKRRPAIAELIEAASGPIAMIGAVNVPGLDEDIDVGAALARARVLATGDLDAELDALRESAAAPIAEIGIEAASAELARQLGGVAVRRVPAGWAPPPAIVEEKKPEEPKPQPVVETTSEPAAEAMPEPVVEEAKPEPEREATPPPSARAESPVAPEPADTMADDDYDVRTPATPQAMLADDGEQSEPSEPDEHAHEVEPDQIHDEIHQLSDADYEEVEHTHIGEVAPPSFEEHVFATTPSVEQHAMAERLDQHLAEVEAENEHDDLGIGEASGRYLRSKIGLPPAEIYEGDAQVPDELPGGAEPATANPTLPPEYQQDFIHHFRPQSSEPAYEEPAESYAEQPVEQRYEAAPEAIDAYGQTIDAALLQTQPAAVPDEDVEEIDDFEILAEADEEDADLLSSSGEEDASGSRERQLPPPSDSDFAMPARPSHSDFAMRLDLGDEEPEQSGFTPVPYEQYPQHDPVAQPMDLAASAGHALAGFDDHEDASASYTFDEIPPHQEAPEHLPADDFMDEGHGFSPPGRFDQSDVIPLSVHEQRTRPRHDSRGEMPTPTANEPYVLRGPPPGDVKWDENSHRNKWQAAAAPSPSEEIDLESALQALDVDLDDLSVPHASTELARDGSQGRRASIRPPSSSQLPGTEPSRKSTRTPRRAPRASTDDGVLIDFDDDED